MRRRIAWLLDAACASTNPDLFFPPKGGATARRQTLKALRVCAACGVTEQCLSDALRTGDVDGIRGGLTGKARSLLLQTPAPGRAEGPPAARTP